MEGLELKAFLKLKKALIKVMEMRSPSIEKILRRTDYLYEADAMLALEKAYDEWKEGKLNA